jgi:glycerol transport system substrate-binding protein
VKGSAQDAQDRLDPPRAPVARLDNEDPTPVTISYDELIQSWRN